MKNVFRWPSINDLASSVNAGRIAAADNVRQSLKLIDNARDYNAVIATLDEAALSRAQSIDRLVKTGQSAGRLAGVPFIAKDNFLVFGAETTAASNILKGFKPPYQATAIQRLEAEGAICVAKANMDAFAHGASTENSDFGVTRNPHDVSRVPGGSSGGSAAAVSLGLAPFALGTDTGGSIRQPASFCGVVGLKPTYGLVSRSGVIAMASSLDTIGPLTTTVEDAELVLDVMSGQDSLDATTIKSDPAGYLVRASAFKGRTIGLVKEYMGDGVNPEIEAAVHQIADRLRQHGATVTEVSIPSLPLALACYYILCPAEVSSNLSRYDGQRYGYSAVAKDLESSYMQSRGQGFGKEAKRRIMIGTYVLSSGYYDAYYKKAQIVRTKLIDEFNQAFAQAELLIGPVAPSTAFKIGEHSTNPLDMYLSDVMTVAANLTGIPSISLPIGLDGQHLPIGLQIMAGQRQDRELLSAAAGLEAML